MPRKSKNQRREQQIRINLSQDEIDRIEALERLVEADSKAAALRDALKLLEFIGLQTENAGWSFYERAPTGDKRPLVLPDAPASSRTEPKFSFKLHATEAAVQRMDHLQSVLGAGTRSDLIRQALSGYEYVADLQNRGWTFAATTGSGEQKELVFLYLPTPT